MQLTALQKLSVALPESGFASAGGFAQSTRFVMHLLKLQFCHCADAETCATIQQLLLNWSQCFWIALLIWQQQQQLPTQPYTAGESEDFVRVSSGRFATANALWPTLADALLMFPYTKPVRLALLHLLCSQQVSPRTLLQWV